MSDNCDRCPARADYEASQAHGARLTLCRACMNRHNKALRARGWLLSPLRPYSSAPQEA